MSRYSPQLRTAVLLSGSGTAGAYHAGVLRALHEAGIKLDVVSGRGVGAVGALFAAIDAAPKMWEDGGLWRRPKAVALYRWRRPLRLAAVLFLVAAGVLLVPLVVLASGLLAYPLSFLLQMISVDAGQRVATAYAGWIARSFAPEALPTYVPRLVTLAIASAVLAVAAAAIAAGRGTSTAGHRARGAWWSRLAGSPWSPDPAISHFQDSLWTLFRGPANAKAPAPAELSRRYMELLTDNLGQPGFRELMMTALDLESRQDVIFAALREERRSAFFARRQGELVDLAGVGRNQAIAAMSAALSLPVLTRPHLIAFSPESYWKGETHRFCDRPAVIDRLMHELAGIGVEQLIIVSASAAAGAPHRLLTPSESLKSRVSDHLCAAEAAAVRDAVASQATRFEGVFAIQPLHNPVGPFDFSGGFDERSDRFQTIGELMDRGYEDAYRQFIEPVVGAAE